MSIPERKYLGRVKQAPYATGTYRYANVEPLIESDAKGFVWSGPVPDPQVRFRQRGLVHWREAPTEASLGSIWQFSVDDQPFTDRSDRQELLKLVDPIEPVEVMDVREWGDEMAFRSLITDEGVELSQAPLARRLVLWMAGGSCVGPLVLKRAADGVRWVFDAVEGQRDAARVPAWVPEDRVINSVVFGGTSRLFLAPGQALGKSAGVQNWLPDGQVLRSILKRLRKIDSRSVGETKGTDKVTERVFDEYLDRVASASFPLVDLAVERARADRLRGIRRAMERDRELLAKVVEELFEGERVQGALVKEVQEARTRMLDEKRREVDSELESQHAELARLNSSLEERRTQLKQAESELEEKVSAFDQEVTERLDAIARRPEAAFAESAMIRAAIQPLLSAAATVPVSTPRRRTPEKRPAMAPISARSLTAESELRNEIARAAINAGVSVQAALTLHATLVAGTTPLLVGDKAYDLVRLYASAAAGGRLLWVPIGSSLLEAQDLLGRFDATLQRIVPHPAGILDLIRETAASGRIALVVLEGFNRAPIEAYLLPILEAASGARMGDEVRRIPIASASIVGSDDEYFEQTAVAWPPNVLIVCIPAQGSTILPVPQSAWRYLTMIDADDRDRPPMSLPTSLTTASPPSVTELPADVWLSLSVAGAQAGDTSDEMLVRLVSELNLSRYDLATALAVHRALRRNGLATNEAAAIAVATVLIPRTVASEKKIDEFLRNPGSQEILGWRFIRSEAHQLRQ